MTATTAMGYEIKVLRTNKSKLPEVDLKNIVFGRIFTDHMLVADYYDGDWHDAEIKPFQNLSLHPATTALHYGQEIFEGLKAYKDKDGNVLLFRVRDNWRRMNASARRMVMPEIPEEIFVEGIKKWVAMDHEWIPTAPGSSLYIRPFMISTDEFVGIKPSDHYKFVTFGCPVNAYYSEPIKVKIELDYVRASVGGTGEAKAAGNYAASLMAVSQAAKQGYRQMIWTDALEHKWIEESGTMNIFFVIGDRVITPELSGTILRGITRDSVITLLKDAGIKIEERKISVDEVVQAYRDGQLKEVFGTGTAATIADISAIGYKDEEFTLTSVNERKISPMLMQTLEKIKRGEAPDTHGWIEKVKV